MSDDKKIEIPEETKKIYSEYYEKHKNDWEQLITGDEEFVAMKKPGEIKVDNWKNESGKYLSTVVDDAIRKDSKIYITSRTQIRASYIKNKDQITELTIQKFKVKKGKVLPNPIEIRIDTKNLATLISFLDFLKSANLQSVTSGKLVLEKEIVLDSDIDAKLRSLASDKNGKEKLLKLFDDGYLTSDLDIPELIKKGLSKQKIEEKLEKIKEFKKMIDDPNVKEVGDIQKWLKSNPWMFGPEYKKLDYRNAGNSGYPDGRLLRIDGLSDILEVKLPKEELLREDNIKRQYLAPGLTKAIGQLTGYLDYYYSEYSQEFDDSSGEEILEDRLGKYYKPKGILLIGRRSKEDCSTSKTNTINASPKKLRRLLSYFHWIEVITYDDLIDRARNGLLNLIK